MLLTIKDKFKHMISRELGFIDDISKRIRVESDTDIYNAKEDEYIWRQANGIEANYFSVYFDNTFVTGFTMSEDPQTTFLRFSRELKKLTDNGSITLSMVEVRNKEQIDKEAKKEQKRVRKQRLDAIPDSTKEQKMVKEAIRRANRRVFAE